MFRNGDPLDRCVNTSMTAIFVRTNIFYRILPPRRAGTRQLSLLESLVDEAIFVAMHIYIYMPVSGSKSFLFDGKNAFCKRHEQFLFAIFPWFPFRARGFARELHRLGCEKPKRVCLDSANGETRRNPPRLEVNRNGGGGFSALFSRRNVILLCRANATTIFEILVAVRFVISRKSIAAASFLFLIHLD